MEKPNLNQSLHQARETFKQYWYVPGLLILLALLFLAGSWYGKKVADQKTTGGRRILHYVDPMNPAHTSSEPGLAPCGMKMEPVFADDGGQAAASAMHPGSIQMTPEKQQIIGVRIATVEKSPWTHTLRTVGKVAVDQTRVYRLNAFTEGWVVKIFDNTNGSLVRKDEPLATFYNRDLPTTLQTFYYAIDSVDRINRDPNLLSNQRDLLLAQKLSAEGVLMNLGLGRPQLEDLIRSRKLTQEIIISAPATSFVLARNITLGQKFAAGEELYRLADLGQVWVLADLFENEATYVRPGEKVSVTLPKLNEKRQATVSEVLPEFDPATLTLKVRLDMDNSRFALRPGMFVDVEFPLNLPPTVNIPVEAVMDAGIKQTVFVDRGNGHFDPRRVKTGWRLGDRVEIVEGLEPGERIVISGNFLIDSESRMRLAAAGIFGEVVKDPVCGLNVDESKSKAAGFRNTFENQTYYFCSQGCKKHFENNPKRYAVKPGQVPEAAGTMSGDKAAAEPAETEDPVCAQEVGTTQAKAGGLTSDYKGITYYFCSYNCNKRFDQDAESYGRQGAQAEPGDSKTRVPAKPAKDPVCGLEVAKGAAKRAGRTSEYQGKIYFFDTDGCKQRFDHAPQRYLSSGPGATPIEIQPYPNTAVDKRTYKRLMPQTQILMSPPAATPPKPPGPTPPMDHPGEAHAVPPAMSHGGAQVTPPAATPSTPSGATAVAPQGPDQAKPPEPQTSPPPPQAPPAAPAEPSKASPPPPAPHACPEEHPHK